MDLGIRGRKALVCASSQGLGYACALALAQEGCEVWLNGRDAAKLAGAVERLSADTGTAVHGVVADLVADAGRAELLAACPAPDLLVNNNAGPPPGQLADWDQIMQQQAETNTDFEVRSLDSMCVNESHLNHKWYHNIKYLFVGIAFGIVLVKTEVISWFRIQEMFRLQSFHMYGVIGSAVAVGIISVWLIKKFNIKTIYGEPIEFVTRKFNKGNISDDYCMAPAGLLRVHVRGPCLPSDRHSPSTHSHYSYKGCSRHPGVCIFL